MSASISTPQLALKAFQVTFALLALGIIPLFGIVFIQDRFVCRSDADCESEDIDIIGLLLTAAYCLAHAILIAVFAWTPLSSTLRKPLYENRPSLFNIVLNMSILTDVCYYTGVAGFGVKMNDLVTILQVLTISFNLPFLLAIPYLLAAYRDPSTDIGAFLHYAKARILASTDWEYSRCQNTVYDFTSLSQPTPGGDDDFSARLESALMILPRVRSSSCPQHQCNHSRSQSQSQTQVGRDEEESKSEDTATEVRERMRPFPRFMLFVTAPNNNTYQPLQPEP